MCASQTTMEVAIILNRCLVVLTEQNLCVHLPAHIFLFFFLSIPPSLSATFCLSFRLLLSSFFRVSCRFNLSPPSFDTRGAKLHRFFRLQLRGKLVGKSACCCRRRRPRVYFYIMYLNYMIRNAHTQSSVMGSQEYRVTKPPGITSVLVFFQLLLSTIIKYIRSC